MKTKVLAIFAAVVLVCAFTVNAGAQTMLTDDVAFVKLGYSMMTVKYDEEGVEDIDGNGFNLQGEYNMNLGGVMLGFGLEYTYMPAESEYDVGTEKFKFHYLTPMVSAKFITAGGFYLGAGLAGKYLVGQSYDGDAESSEYDQEIDLWANAVIGFMTPIQEFVYIDIEARFGYNLTNNQFKKGEYDTGSSIVDFDYAMNSQYDIAFYAGIGYRVAATGF